MIQRWLFDLENRNIAVGTFGTAARSQLRFPQQQHYITRPAGRPSASLLACGPNGEVSRMVVALAASPNREANYAGWRRNLRRRRPKPASPVVRSIKVAGSGISIEPLLDKLRPPPVITSPSTVAALMVTFRKGARMT